ncbi:MAG: outer membrane protein assembly factor BamD [Nitrospinae bacterium]|nr:outer membrane protein assembly factor BamD [Nitrospinota bacterium]
MFNRATNDLMTVAFSLVCVLLILSGCVSRPKEQASPGELLVIGEEDMRAERFEAARLAFKRLLEEYPDSKHRRSALLSLGDSYYHAEEYIESKLQYAEYVRLYPVSAGTPKAYYFLAMSDYQRNLDIDQDASVARDALENFQTLVRRFPGSEYTTDAKQKTLELREHLAQNALFIANFYFRTNLRVSAIPRYREIIRDFEDVPYVRAEAMYKLGESYRIEESFKKAGEAYGLLLESYPDDQYASPAYNRLLALTSKK